jgi:predicted Zn-dependent protease
LNQQGVNAKSTGATSNNGLNAYEATATGQTQEGDKVAFYLYSVQYDNSIYRFICYTLANKFATYNSIFKHTSNGFARLQDQSILDIKPARLHVFQANKTAPFKSFLPDHLPLDIKPEEVAVANQVKLDQTIKKGTWIKIPRQ